MAKKTRKKTTSGANRFFNRELSWLEFNDRVLREGLLPDLPLLERLKFLAIVSSNLDEFFMIRVAGLRQMVKAGVRKRDLAGMSPHQQLRAIADRVHRMVDEQSAGIREVLSALREHGIVVLTREEWNDDDRRFLAGYFEREIQPILTPLAIAELDPPPLLPGLQLNVVAKLERARGEGESETETESANSRRRRARRKVETESEDDSSRIVVFPVPTRYPRFVALPTDTGHRFALLEDIVAAFAERMCSGYRVLSAGVFRITRDADVPIQDDDASDLLNVVERAVLDRRRRAAVRLEHQQSLDRELV
ncbi:MAG: hypothetical protein D6741_18690, partial [Planctomycetota bacterium]